ncbi:MAG: hypothetical protein HAW62_01125 [Endozoicomonadaceae bacterium]|nr:hypothetical protein [Endozoicomonadaceae bacterium]
MTNNTQAFQEILKIIEQSGYFIEYDFYDMLISHLILNINKILEINSRLSFDVNHLQLLLMKIFTSQINNTTYLQFFKKNIIAGIAWNKKNEIDFKNASILLLNVIQVGIQLHTDFLTNHFMNEIKSLFLHQKYIHIDNILQITSKDYTFNFTDFMDIHTAKYCLFLSSQTEKLKLISQNNADVKNKKIYLLHQYILNNKQDAVLNNFEFSTCEAKIIGQNIIKSKSENDVKLIQEKLMKYQDQWTEIDKILFIYLAIKTVKLPIYQLLINQQYFPKQIDNKKLILSMLTYHFFSKTEISERFHINFLDYLEPILHNTDKEEIITIANTAQIPFIFCCLLPTMHLIQAQSYIKQLIPLGFRQDVPFRFQYEGTNYTITAKELEDFHFIRL